MLRRRAMASKAIFFDLDNTLYNWKEFYVPSLLAQITYLARKLSVDEMIIEKSLKKVFEKYGSVEIPNVVFELDILNDINNIEKDELRHILKISQNIFFQELKKNLKLFPNVEHTLKWAKINGILAFGFSDAFAFWADYRLNYLQIGKYFDAIYAVEDSVIRNCDIVKNYIRSENIIPIPKEHAKPSTIIIDEVIEQYHLLKENVFLLGDSMEKDVLTAKQAGINAIWAKYGTVSSKGYGELLHIITPWKKEKALEKKTSFRNIEPSFEISNFEELIDVVS